MSVISTESIPSSLSLSAVSPRYFTASGALKILLLVGAYPSLICDLPWYFPLNVFLRFSFCKHYYKLFVLFFNKILYFFTQNGKLYNFYFLFLDVFHSYSAVFQYFILKYVINVYINIYINSHKKKNQDVYFYLHILILLLHHHLLII